MPYKPFGSFYKPVKIERELTDEEKKFRKLVGEKIAKIRAEREKNIPHCDLTFEDIEKEMDIIFGPDYPNQTNDSGSENSSNSITM